MSLRITSGPESNEIYVSDREYQEYEALTQIFGERSASLVKQLVVGNGRASINLAHGPMDKYSIVSVDAPPGNVRLVVDQDLVKPVYRIDMEYPAEVTLVLNAVAHNIELLG